MANLEIEGRLIQKLAVQSGQSARGPWERQDFVVEYMDGSFSTNACFSAWGQDKVQELSGFQVGDQVKVSFNVRGREYNGRWYNDLRMWRISRTGQDAPQQVAPQQVAPQQAVPAETSVSNTPAPAMEDMPTDFEDDLPF